MTARARPLPRHDSPLADAVRDFCHEARGVRGGERPAFSSSPLWRAVVAAGTEPWFDTGDVEAAREMWTREFRALTTNNTLLNKEVQKGLYDELVPDAAAIVRGAARDVDDRLLVLETAFVLNALHGLELVRTFGADVSVELHTDLADDADASFEYGMRYARICPDRFIVKVPLTPAGLLAARRLVREGIRVNFTLGFSARQNLLIGRMAGPTYVNVFLGRLNAFVADNGFGDGRNVGEKATLASQRMLREEGLPCRQIAASIRSGAQCLDLLGVDVITMPTKAAAEIVEAAPDASGLVDRTGEDPEVRFGEGVDVAGLGLEAFWRIDEGFRAAVNELGDREDLDAATVRACLAERGCGGVLPELSGEERVRITEEGKIPNASSWERRVREGTASWDGLLTAAALASFAADQRALDDRIRGLL